MLPRNSESVTDQAVGMGGVRGVTHEARRGGSRVPAPATLSVSRWWGFFFCLFGIFDWGCVEPISENKMSRVIIPDTESSVL